MSSLRLLIEEGQFRDQFGRELILRGINVAADAKYPSEPDQPSHIATAFFDGDNVKFHDRPFPRDEAHVHFSRLKGMGYNLIRYIFNWESIEAAGPGKYDDEYCQQTIDVLRIAKQYGFYIFMDPHQDVWSRFCGGSGAPMWTLYACGLNPQSFAATEAAIVQNTYPDPATFPKMIWSTNYYRLATATCFTLFWAGKDFAPKCIIDGMNIQDYLQGHFIDAVGYLARKIAEAGDILDDVVFGWETINEPHRGLIGHEDISIIPEEQNLKKGTCPTIWQAILTGSGRACEVDTYDMGGLGPYKVGQTLVDPHGESAWLPADYDDSRYGYKRDPGWKLGECIWAQHGVWDPSTDTLLRKDYFARHPKTGEELPYHKFTNTYWMDHFRKYKAMIRKWHPNAVLLCQPPVFELPPSIKGTADEDDRMVYCPHFYDGITLMTKKWNRLWNVDILGILRGKYWHKAFAVKVGEAAIRKCFMEQLAAMRQEGRQYMGNHPCILTEFGIPYDMDDKRAYRTGDFSSQSAAMDANYSAAEGAMLEGYCLWVYMTKNDHIRGDQWNGEDLSVYSLDDLPLPVSQLPLDAVTGELPDISRTTTLDKEAPRSIASSRGTNGSTTPFANANGAAMAVAAPLAAMSLKDMETKGNAMSGGDPPSSMDDQSNGSAKSNGAVITVKDVKGPTTSLATPPTHMHAHTATVTPANLKRTLTSQTISSAPQAPSPAVAELTVTPGYRAAEAYVRPCPVYVAGRLISYAFDLRQCEFTLKLDRGDRGAVLDAHPTIIYLPEFHFPRDHKVVVDVSSGKWEISEGEIASPGTPTAANGKRIANDTLVKVNADLAAIEADGGYAPGENDGDPPVQRLRWWHGDGEQTLRVTGLIRRATFAPEGGLVGTTGGVPGGNAADEDASYLEQCQQGYGVNTSSCTLM